MTRLLHTTYGRSANVFALRKLVAARLHNLRWRWHGIGALQAYAFEREGGARELRVHIWSPQLVLDSIEESGNAHNHRFTLHSTLLCGSLLHTEWQLEEGHGYALYDFVHARLHTEANRADMERLPGEVAVRKAPLKLIAGDVYTFERGAYHSSMPTSDLVVTLVEKLDQVEERARVVAPVDKPPVPAFSGGPINSSLLGSLLAQAYHELMDGAEPNG